MPPSGCLGIAEKAALLNAGVSPEKNFKKGLTKLGKLASFLNASEK
jgi:hypothetical protein